ncbi:uncharacterized protein LOC126379844 [Pectinophora gossypiella]|uniref:uncharacterized protein LOC126371366 n=1 Tax=Pectinophora gossypiella TaxID=13191 RepID=UPI00214E2C88|nr:uncharacterized protein LOC126371366 [Pectinophora gossypiella]XP_049884745.1 uncharacterized protein LOC126379844 [Pectinophora gossypiella]
MFYLVTVLTPCQRRRAAHSKRACISLCGSKKPKDYTYAQLRQNRRWFTQKQILPTYLPDDLLDIPLILQPNPVQPSGRMTRNAKIFQETMGYLLVVVNMRHILLKVLPKSKEGVIGKEQNVQENT